MSLLEELVDARRERQQFKEWWVQERDLHAATQKELTDLKVGLVVKTDD